MKYLVTGGAGFIGANFVFYMLQEHPDDEIVCYDALTYAGNLETLESVMDHPKFRFVKGDVADREAVFRLFAGEGFDVVVNFAAESHVDRSGNAGAHGRKQRVRRCAVPSGRDR